MGQHSSRVNAAKYRAATDRQVQSIVARRKIGPDGCWLWPGYVNPDGYAVTRIGARIDGRRPEVMIHRLIYMRLVGELADTEQVDHTCHNPDVCTARQRDCLHRRCFNPEHLQAVPGTVNLMRSGNFAAVNGTKTHCKRGHEFTPENTHITPDGERRCRACGRWHAANDYAARRTGPSPVRECRQCGGDIAHLNGTIWYCKTCRPVPNLAQKRRDAMRGAERNCADCGVDISGRYLTAVRCEACSRRRIRESNNQATRSYKERQRVVRGA